MKPVTRMGRALDLVGLLVFLGGVGLFVRAWAGFHDVPAFDATAGGEAPWAAIRLADGFWRLQRIGVAVMLVGVALFVFAWWAERRASTDSDAP